MYNTEKYIERCITSCLSQDIPYSDYEVIVVDDGSTDNGYKVVKNICEEYNNVKLIFQENKGLSGARNTGLEYARGEYIWFIDSDDWIKNKCLSSLLELIKKGALDILEFNYTYASIMDREKMTYSTDSFMNNIITEKVVSGKSFLEYFGYVISVTTKIIRKSLFVENNLCFPIGVFSEDNIIAFDLMLTCSKYYKVNTAIYYYFQRTDSITNNRDNSHLIKYAKDQWDNILIMTRRIKNIKDENPDFKIDKLNGMVIFLVENLLFSLILRSDFATLKKYLKIMKYNKITPISLKGYYRGFCVKRFLFRVFVNTLGVFY